MIFKATITRFALTTLVAIGVTVDADLITPVSVTGHNGGQGFGSPSGELITMIDGSGMDTSVDPNDPGTWTTTGNAWPDEWQSTSLLSGASNNKIGWTALDLGAPVANLENLHVWHIRENNQRYAATYNVYTATSPTVALPATPGETVTIGDYDFASGGWTQLGATQNGTFRGNQIVALGGGTAQYIGLEILTNNGHAQRVGFAELAVTAAIPEPNSLTLLGLGLLVMLRRRKW